MWVCGFFARKHKHKSAKWILLYSVQCTQKPHSDFAESNQPHTKSHQLRTITLRGHNSVPWMNAATQTPYHECSTQFVDSVKSLSISLTRGFFRPIAYIHGTELVWPRSFMELMQFGKVILWSTKISIQWLWPNKVTSKVNKRRPKFFCWFCDEGPLKWEEKKFQSLKFTSTDRTSLISILLSFRLSGIIVSPPIVAHQKNLFLNLNIWT